MSPRRPAAARPPGGPVRRRVEQRSAVLLVALTGAPRWALPLVSVLLLGGVLFLPASAALACLLVLVALVAWLTYLSWPVVDGRGRAVRLGSLALLVVLGAQSVLR